MRLSDVLRIRYRGFVGKTVARISEVPVFEIDPAEFRRCAGEQFEEVDLAELPQELHLQSRSEPHGHEWIEFQTSSDRLIFETWREPGDQSQEQAPGYDSLLRRLFLAVQRCAGSEFYLYHEAGAYPLIPAWMSGGLALAYPEVAEWLDEMGAHRDQLEAPMLGLLRWTAENPVRAARLDFPDNWMPLFAMQLLAYWRVPTAHRSLVDLLRSSPDDLDRILGDLLTEGYDRFLSATARPPFSELRAIVEDPVAFEFARACALRALGNVARNDSWAYDEFVGWMRQLGSKLLVERPPCFLHDAFVCDVADSGIRALRAEAEALFDEDLVDPVVISRSEFHQSIMGGAFGDQPPKTLARASEGLRVFLKSAFGSEEAQSEVHETVGSSRKVGRNEPCPCGSEVKYKKCCGKP
jgi:Protein of unknown function (DUF1186)/SEC-C motif